MRRNPGWTSRGIDPLRRPVWDAGNHTRRRASRQWKWPQLGGGLRQPPAGPVPGTCVKSRCERAQLLTSRAPRLMQWWGRSVAGPRLDELLGRLLHNRLADTDDLVASGGESVGPEIPSNLRTGHRSGRCGSSKRGYCRRRWRDDGGGRCTGADDDQRDDTAEFLDHVDPSTVSSKQRPGAAFQERAVFGPALFGC